MVKRAAAAGAVRSVADYLTAVKRIARGFEKASPDCDGPWFRGANDSANGLIPGTYWRKNVDELALMVDFMAQAPPFLNPVHSPHMTLWEWYFLMQHYGLPTRLLDWSENALVGLFFALEPIGPRPCVWVLEPAGLNTRSIHDSRVIAPGGRFSQHWLPLADDDQRFGCRIGKTSRFRYANRAYTNRDPMAIYAVRRNERILAQQGTFTVHGSEKRSLHTFLGVSSWPLARIDVDPKARTALLRELALCGMSVPRLFPELEKLAPSIKSQLGITP